MVDFGVIASRRAKTCDLNGKMILNVSEESWSNRPVECYLAAVQLVGPNVEDAWNILQAEVDIVSFAKSAEDPEYGPNTGRAPGPLLDDGQRNVGARK
jgi:hypothetical protein